MGDGFDENSYLLLRNLKVEISRGVDVAEEANGCFALCFWLYIDSFASSPSAILVQRHPDVKSSVPFLWLDGTDKVKLFPLLYIHQEAPNADDSVPWTEETPCVSSEIEFPLKKWVHLGCEVLPNLIRFHLNGEVIGEKPFTCLLNPDLLEDVLKKISLSFPEENDDSFRGYVHGLDILFPAIDVKCHYLKDPPFLLSIDDSSVAEIEEDSSGVWSIVGGKATCRRIFSLDVTLLDVFGSPVSKDLEVVASLLYADNETPVENTSDDESPLFISCDGIEYASHDRPCRLVNGRASFKLKISQLSSKCENRLFRVKFEVPNSGKYPFLETLSLPIRCISRSKNTRTNPLTWKNSSDSTYNTNGCESPVLVDGSSMEQIPKRIKLGHDIMPLSMFKEDSAQADDGCDQRNAHRMMYGAENGQTSTSDSSGAANSGPKNIFSSSNPISDSVIFKYCLGGFDERCHLLKGIAISASEEQVENFGKQVSLFSGCSHHWHQIRMAKRLMEDGIQFWAFISHKTSHVLWENLVPMLNKYFMKIASSTRSLSDEDFECLRTISGVQQVVYQENFERMWSWLYPVARTLSQGSINATWNSLQPMWVQGFITKEEAESSLKSPHGNFRPGTFVLRFPTSRSWPHPDAGNLVVTYVASDYAIHHRLLSLEFAHSASKEGSFKPLHEMLVEEPELSRPARLVRSD